MIVEFMRYGDLANVLRTNSGVLSLQQTESPSLEMVIFTRNTRCILLLKQIHELPCLFVHKKLQYFRLICCALVAKSLAE